jgi:excisionase family DNA binding protein
MVKLMPQQASNERVLLSTTEAMEASGFSREHIQRLLRNKKVEGVKPGHDWFVYEDSLKTFLAQPRKTGPKPKQPQSQQSSLDIVSAESDQKIEASKP